MLNIFVLGSILISVSLLIWKDSRGVVPGSIFWIGSTASFLASLVAQVFAFNIYLLSFSAFLGFISWWLLVHGYFEHYSIRFPFGWRYIIGFSVIYSVIDYICMLKDPVNRFLVVNGYFLIGLIVLGVWFFFRRNEIPHRKLLALAIVPMICALNGAVRFMQALFILNDRYWFSGGKGETFFRAAIFIQLILVELYELRLVNKHLLNTIREMNDSFARAQQGILSSLVGYSDNNSNENISHVSRVGSLAENLALATGWDDHSARELNEAAQFHDIGKITIPDTILEKNGKLSETEFEIIKTHSLRGYELLSHYQVSKYQTAANIALQHHENWDGTGYPQGLTALNISRESRIVAICDTIDALSRKRCYKDAWSLAEIHDYLLRERGKRFDPDLIDACIQERIWER